MNKVVIIWLLGLSLGIHAKEHLMTKEVATLGGGCFWCLEAVYEETRGVLDVVSGYAGGSVPSPTYEQVSSGTTGHAEVVQITYDKAIVSYEELLKIFWLIHDPTSLNRQGNDIGTQYRSVIFYHDEKQKALAQASIDTFAPKFSKPMVTQLLPLRDFYQAEMYHQDYFKKNPAQGYCSFVVAPKVQKFKKEYKDLAK